MLQRIVSFIWIYIRIIKFLLGLVLEMIVCCSKILN